MIQKNENPRDLLVKQMLKDTIVEDAEYDRIYSNVYKSDGSLRVKFWNVKSKISLKSIKKKLDRLDLGQVDVIVGANRKNSIAVYIPRAKVM